MAGRHLCFHPDTLREFITLSNSAGGTPTCATWSPPFPYLIIQTVWVLDPRQLTFGDPRLRPSFSVSLVRSFPLIDLPIFLGCEARGLRQNGDLFFPGA